MIRHGQPQKLSSCEQFIANAWESVFLTPNLIWFVSTVLGRCSFLRDLCFEAVRLTCRVSEQICKLSAVAVSQPDHNLLRAVTHLTT